MRHYETLYIVSPELSDEDYKAVLNKYKDLIDREKGVIVRLDEWGKRKLAYELRKFDNGSYVLMDYCGGPGITVELERDLKLDDRVLKYQTVKLADNVDPEALIRKQKEAENETAATEDQAPEKEEVVQDEGIESDQEVNNGVQ